MTDDKTGAIKSTKKQYGLNYVADFGKQAATFLGLPNPNSYKGHTWRRSCITKLAEEGLTLPQMKVVTGHRSDTVLQGYIDRSKRMQTVGANAIAIGGSSRNHEGTAMCSAASSAATVTTKRKLGTAFGGSSAGYHFHGCNITNLHITANPGASEESQELQTVRSDKSYSEQHL